MKYFQFKDVLSYLYLLVLPGIVLISSFLAFPGYTTLSIISGCIVWIAVLKATKVCFSKTKKETYIFQYPIQAIDHFISSAFFYLFTFLIFFVLPGMIIRNNYIFFTNGAWSWFELLTTIILFPVVCIMAGLFAGLIIVLFKHLLRACRQINLPW